MTMNPKELYESLIARTSLAELTPEAAIQHLGLLIDVSLDAQRPEGLRHAIILAGELARTPLTPVDAVTLDYFLGNAWDNLRRLSRPENHEAWEWQQEEFEKEITHLRLALRGEGFAEMPAVRRRQILTNLGNAMSELGRFIEATEYLSRALADDASFSMAQGNRGVVLSRYAQTLYDPGHAMVLIRRAREDLGAALRGRTLHPGAKKFFEARAAWVEEVLKKNARRKKVDLEGHSLGEQEAEVQYRRWCLERGLFLNPLNDLGPHPIAAHDVLTTPSITVGLDEGPSYPGFFNQMKQEFVSARYLYYEGVSAEGSHFSDRRVLLYNTLDYPAYSLSVEKVKAAFRTAYSLLDKAAYFLNDYLKLGIPERRASFKTFWYEGQERKRGLRAEFAKRPNWPLRGLFWLSKDLYEPVPGFREAVEPDAEKLAEIRNHLEHKYLKIHDMLVRRQDLPDPLADTLAFSVARRDFEAKALRLLKMARAALIYLSLAVHSEERRKAAGRGEKPIVPMFLGRWEDDWKL